MAAASRAAIRSATTDLANSEILLWRTDDGCGFTDAIAVRTGTVDHPGWPPAEPRTRRTHLYMAWADGSQLSNGLAFSRSTDGGRTFFLDPGGRVPMIAAGPDSTRPHHPSGLPAR